MRTVMLRLRDLNRAGDGDPAVRPGDDISAIILRAVREASPAIADAVERRLGVAIPDASG
jgi:hypothetical protein